MKLTLLSLALLPAVTFAAQPLIRPLSHDSAASGHSTTPLLSADAKSLFFLSDAANLLPLPTTQRWNQVYRRDLVTSNLTLVSVNESGEPAAGNIALAAVSDDGQVVAFVSDAPHIAPGDDNGAHDLFVRDLSSGTTRLVTRDPDVAGSQAVRASSVGAVLMSRDGQWIFYESTATNVTVDADENGAFDLFAYHRGSETNQLVVRSALNPAATPFGGARLLSIMSDGSKVAFLTASSSNVVPSVVRPGPEVFVREMSSGDTLWVSQLESFFDTDYRCLKAALSESGGFVALTAAASNGPVMLFRCDLGAGGAVLVAANVVADRNPLISGDGQTLVYEDGTNVYRWRADTGVAHVVNITTNGVVADVGRSRNAAMTADGNHVCFCSKSSGLTTNSPGGVFQIYCRDFTSGETWLVTQRPDLASSADHTGFSGIDLGSDGSTIAFDSAAGDLTPDDNNAASDVFVRNRGAVSPFMVSYRSSNIPRQTALGFASIAPFCLSSNGTQLAFTSWDTDGIPDDTNRQQNAFVADLEAGLVAAVGFPQGIRSMAISADGRYLAAYVDTRENGQKTVHLSRFDLATQSEVVLAQTSWDYVPPVPAISADGSQIASTLFGSLKLYHVATGANLYQVNVTAQALYDTSVDALISADSRFVVFSSSGALHVYDWQNQITDNLGPTTYDPVMSGNSRYLAFPTNVSAGSVEIVRRDLVTKQNEVVGQNLRALSMSADGRFIAGERPSLGAPLSDPRQIVLVDCNTKQTNVISVSTSGEPGNGRSRFPVLSANGRYVAYLTESQNIVPGNVPHRQQVVLRDMLLGQTLLLSASTVGAPGNNHSSRPYISANGRTIVFQSMASDLTPGDYNNARDIFIVKLSEPDADGDGMDDGWEVTYFGDLARGGDSDMDGDGGLDRGEFLAGTDPTNSGSVFRVLTISRLGGLGRTVIWNGSPGMTYRVEYKDDLAGGWTQLQATTSWSGNTARADDPSAASARFYRVVRLP